MTIKVYVAGSSQEFENARKHMDLLRELGAEITYDWTKDVEQLGGNPVDMDPDTCRHFARRDLQGIEDADVMLMLVSTVHVSRGAHIEYGYALARGIPIVITSYAGSIFYPMAVIYTSPYGKHDNGPLFTAQCVLHEGRKAARKREEHVGDLRPGDPFPQEGLARARSLEERFNMKRNPPAPLRYGSARGCSICDAPAAADKCNTCRGFGL